MVIAQVLHQIHILPVDRVGSEKNKPLRCFIFSQATVVQILAKSVEVRWSTFFPALWEGVPNFKDQFSNILNSRILKSKIFFFVKYFFHFLKTRPYQRGK